MTLVNITVILFELLAFMSNPLPIKLEKFAQTATQYLSLELTSYSGARDRLSTGSLSLMEGKFLTCASSFII